MHGKRQSVREKETDFSVPISFEWKLFDFPLASHHLGKHLKGCTVFVKSNYKKILSPVHQVTNVWILFSNFSLFHFYLDTLNFKKMK